MKYLGRFIKTLVIYTLILAVALAACWLSDTLLGSPWWAMVTYFVIAAALEARKGDRNGHQ